MKRTFKQWWSAIPSISTKRTINHDYDTCIWFTICHKIMKYLQLETKYAPTLDNYGQCCFVRSDFLKWSVSVRHKWCPRLTIRNYKQVKSSLTLCMMFYQNQNPVDMHTSIMCINILQNIKAVALKL